MPVRISNKGEKMKKSVKDFQLNVKPVFFAMEHQYYYEGPCRMSSGDALKPGFDGVINGKIYKGFTQAIKFNLENDPRFNVLEPATIRCTDDWDIKEEWFEEALKDDHEADFYLVNTAFGANTVIEEFCLRTKKPIAANPFKMFGQLCFASSVRRGADVIFALDWKELKSKLIGLLAEKIVRNANILCATRFGSDKAMAGGTDTFDNLNLVRDKLGTNFRYVNIHEMMDYMSPLPEGGNHTTPGRITNNITEEEIAQCEELADELMNGASFCNIEKKFVVNSLKAYKVVSKMMDYYDCSAFAAPCPDSCSTRRLNEIQFTFCLTHSLNLEQGFGSACEYDVTTALCMLIVMAISGKAAYMGNTLPCPVNEKGEINFSDPKYETDVDTKENLYVCTHSTPCRAFHGFDNLDEYALRHFALDAGFGAVQRHDFQKDKGQTITMIRISSDCKQMFIGKGEIVAGLGYDTDNCNGGFIFKVNDINDFFQKHARFGLHLPLVYGDYVEELSFVAERLGLEPVIA